MFRVDRKKIPMIEERRWIVQTPKPLPVLSVSQDRAMYPGKPATWSAFWIHRLMPNGSWEPAPGSLGHDEFETLTGAFEAIERFVQEHEESADELRDDGTDELRKGS